MKKIFTLTLLTLTLICGGLATSAQTTSFTYQGSVNTSGTPANGNHDFEFALFDALAAGAQLGSTLTRTNVAVTNGVFAVTLDFGSQFPGANRFLEIRVRTSGGGAFTPLAPRQPVNSSPYSINAAQLGGLPASSYATHIGGAVNAGSQYNINGQRVLTLVGGATAVGQNTSTTNTGIFNTFVGNSAGQNNTGGAGNTFVGTASGQANTTGFDNSFFGSGSGSNNTAANNSFFGSRAGGGNIDGTRNSFFGAWSGFANVTGADNAYFGYFAGRFATTSKNAFFGSQAGGNNTTGANNSFFGALAGDNTTTGSDNSFFGAEVGVMNTIGFDNSFFGRFTGFRNTSGNQNSFFGNSAGIDITTGSGNSFFGLAAGSDVITGSRNSFFGYSTGNGNADGNHTSAFGASATTANGLTNATAIGARAMATQSNSLVLGAINGVNNAPADTNVGIGTTAPTNLLTIGGPEATVVAGRVGIFSPAGTNLIMRETTADVEGIMGVNSSNGVIYGSMTNHNVNLRTNNTNRLVIDNTGNVGIGTTAPARRLHLAGGESGATSLSSSDFVIEDDTSAFQHFLTPNDVESGILFGDVTDSVGGGLIFNNAATNNGIQFRAGGNTTRMTLDGSGNLGIGTTAPINRLTVGTPETPVLNGSVGIFNAGGTFLTVRDTTNNIEGFVGADANGVLLGSLTDSVVRIRTGNSNRLVFDPNGNATFSAMLNANSLFSVGILDNGGSTPICRNSNGNFLATCSSSLRYKSNVTPFRSGLSLIRQLRPVSFDWKNGGMHDLGLVAEEVAAVEPLLTTTNAKGEVEGVKYDRVGVVLVNAVREQQVEIEAQGRKIRDQEKVITSQTKTIESQQAQIDGLKKAVCSLSPSAEICKTKK